ncbi:cytochrome P450 3A8-like [Uloborus diversus]|uniref:cytochrome P450 3A8-like n=1 Tax=Uloborus diversus TaxID=327109 RepID=UPI002409A810|nr:cytochrome P450 3A8-like [Uloborus diversus]
MAIHIALLCVIAALWFVWRWKHLQTFKKLGIPGPKPNFIFGNILELYKKGPIKCQEEWVKKHGRVLGYFYGMKPILLVTDPMILKNIFVRDFNKFINREPFNPLAKYSKKDELGQSVLILEGQEWKDVRSVLTPTFTTAKMKQMAGSINSSIETMLDLLKDRATQGKEFDIFDTYQRLTMDVITRTAFGVRTDVQKNFKSRLLHATKLLFSTSYRDPIIFIGLCFPWLRLLCIRIQGLVLGLLNRGTKPGIMLSKGLKQVIEYRRNNPQSKKADLLQLMLDSKIVQQNTDIDVRRLEVGHGEDDSRAEKEEVSNKIERTMSEREIVSTAMVVLLAGYETTSTALSFTTYLLAKHPDVQEKLYQEIHDLVQKGHALEYATVNRLVYLDQVLNESLRIFPPVNLFTNRFAVEDVQYGEFKIPKGTIIQAPVYLMHNDPEFWSEPEKFMPERFSTKPNLNGITYLPFGVGPRNCLGMRLAQLEAKLTLAHIVNNFKMYLSDKQQENFSTALRIRTIAPANGVLVKIELRDVEPTL